jgi:uncharacterized protein YjiS (DUF1127 family)
LERWLVAYMTWRLEQAAIAQLSAMSDRELKDIGLTRCGIANAVSNQAGAAIIMKIAPHRAERPSSALSDHRTLSFGKHPTAASKERNTWDFATARTRQTRRAVISPEEFIWIVAGWAGSLVLLLLIAALAQSAS